MVLEHLISVGATRVGYIAPDDYGVTRARYRGAKRAADAAGISLEWVPIQAMDVAAGVEVGQRLVRSGLPFDGLATANDLVGIGLLRALREAKVPVPGEVAVVGYDDLDRSQDLPIPLTSVRQPKEELGALALEMLISERSREPHRHSSRVLLPELAPRASTAPLRVGRS
ncbi:LacI family transcriptional regulator [Tessaracoccus sp. HDW20]|uniref:LacI family DNA-binding transcriptional regulator n=1 Tax=Tessaracoccus coleopterorum TaxID=2714950 RepID=UPI0018D483B3|nr:substrate-binding domain-containing protein [Tessaracoccus coleopterorum]NHB84361.1 LacI family transcriptional regulator [Tessaracoccus coleopterorum]